MNRDKWTILALAGIWYVFGVFTVGIHPDFIFPAMIYGVLFGVQLEKLKVKNNHE